MRWSGTKKIPTRFQGQEFGVVIKGGGRVDQYSQTMPAEIHDGGSRCCTQAQQGLPRAHSSHPFLPPWPYQSGTNIEGAGNHRDTAAGKCQNPCWNMSWKGEVKPTNQTRSLRNVFSSRSFVLVEPSVLPKRFTIVNKSVIQESAFVRILGRFAARCLHRASLLPKLVQSTQKQPASTGSVGTNRSELT